LVVGVALLPWSAKSDIGYRLIIPFWLDAESTVFVMLKLMEVVGELLASPPCPYVIVTGAD
jgi:hypothetical protein